MKMQIILFFILHINASTSSSILELTEENKKKTSHKRQWQATWTQIGKRAHSTLLVHHKHIDDDDNRCLGYGRTDYFFH